MSIVRVKHHDLNGTKHFWLWCWLLHRLSKRQSLSAIVLVTTIYSYILICTNIPICSVLQFTIVILLSVRDVQLKPDVSHFFLKWSFEEKVYLDDSFVRGWRGLFEYFDMSWFFHESSNEFNKFCLKVNRTITLFGLTYKSERLSAFRYQGSPIRIWVCE